MIAELAPGWHWFCARDGASPATAAPLKSGTGLGFL
jgi:hypothetical protein